MAKPGKKKSGDDVTRFLMNRRARHGQALSSFNNYYAHIEKIRARGNPAYGNSGGGGGGAAGDNPNVQRDENGAVIPGVTYTPGQGVTGMPTASPSTVTQAANSGRGAAAATNASPSTTPVTAPVQQNGVSTPSRDPLTGNSVPSQEFLDSLKPVDEHGVKTAFNNTVHWLSSVFNPDDESDLNIGGVNLSAVESVFDGALTGLGMAADTVNWGLSGAALAANPHYWANRDQGLEGNLWQDATRVSAGRAFQGLVSPLQDVLGELVTGEQQGIYSIRNDIFGDSDFDIAEDHQQAYDRDMAVRTLSLGEFGTIDMTPGQWGSGVGDVMVAAFADPANIAGFGAGKLAKFSRVRYLNKPIVTVEDTKRVVSNLDDGLLKIEDRAREAGVQIADLPEDVVRGMDLTDEARFAWEVSARRETADSAARWKALDDIADPAEQARARSKFIPEYEKAVPLSTIVNHDVIRWATNRDALSAALYNADTYEEAALILRHAANDKSASKALSDVAPRLYKQVLDGERNLVNRMLAADPKLVGEEIAKWDRRYLEAVRRLDELDTLNADPTAVAAMREQLDNITEMWEAARRGALDPVGVGPFASADEVDLARRAVDEQLRHNELFMRSLTDAGGKPNADLLGSLTDTPLGGFMDTGRSILPGQAGAMSEQLTGRMMARMGTSRMNRAARRALAQGRGGRMGSEVGQAAGVAGKAAAAGRSIMRAFTVDEFYGVSGSNPIARVLNWASAERQSGLVYTSGLSAQESAREVRAMLNGVDLYSGEARVIRTPKLEKRGGRWEPVKDENGAIIYEESTVGGLARKEKMIEEYQNAMLLGGAKGDMQVRALLDEIEEQILVDIARWEGIDPEMLRQVHYRQNRKLEKIEKEIREEGYWTDEKGVRNYAPYLESQLQNQSFIKNWRAISGAARQFARKERAGMPTATTAAQAEYLATGTLRMTGRALDDLNNVMQDFWRPAILLRLGYTQRNVSEGLFRSVAFHWSLMPVVDAAWQAGLSTLNTGSRIGRRNARAAKVAELAAEGTPFDQMPRRFQRWRDTQIEAAERQIEVTQTVLNDGRVRLAQQSAAYREKRLADLELQNTRLQKVYAELDQNPFDNAKEMDEVVERVAAIEEQIHSLKQMTGGDDVLDPAVLATMDTLDTIEYVDLEFNRSVRRSLDNVDSAALAYRKQTMANRRNYGGDSSVGDPDTLEAVMRAKATADPFSNRDSFAEIAWQAMSADHTVRQQAAMRMKAVTDALALQETRYFVAVDPADPTYFDGVATVINQFQNSDIGKMVIAGRAAGKPDVEIVEDVVRFLYEDGRGQEVAAFINQANDVMFGGGFESASKRAKDALRSATEQARPLLDEVDDLSQQLAWAQTDLARARLTAGTLVETPPATRKWSGNTYGDYSYTKTGRGQYEIRDGSGNVISTQTNESAARKWLRDTQADDDARTLALIEHAGPSRAAYDDALARVTELREKVAAATAKADDFITKKSVPAPRKGEAARRLSAGELDDARYYAEEVLRRFDQVTDGNMDFQQYLAANPQLPIGGQYKGNEAGKVVRQFLEGSTTLKPVVGNMATFVGEASAMDVYHKVVAASFKALGTIPEDLFVRSQFYGRTFSRHAEAMYDNLLAQSPDGMISFDDINAIRNQSHRRALKDTKDWLYTIDRRTKLGDSLERFVPFISATQNSVTTVGRLIYKDPTVAWAMATIWQLPDRFGDLDGDGNPDTFMIPIGFLPDSWEQQINQLTGTPGKVNLSKGSFDLIFQGVFDPSGPPLVGIASSEMMKHGWLGAQGDTPEWMNSIPNADVLWNYWKDYSLGKDAGASEYFASVDQILAPWQKRLFDAFVAGPGSSASYARTYQSYMLSEQLKHRHGERAKAPTHDEILDLTNHVFKLRALANLTLFTTPKYDTDMQTLADAVNKQDLLFRQDQALPIEQRRGVPSPEELFGDMITASAFAHRRTRENIAGVKVTEYGMAAVKANKDVIAAIAPELGERNMSALGILTEDPDSFFFDGDGIGEKPYEYSQDAAAYFAANKIPGTSSEYRVAADPAEAQHQAKMRVAWRKYMIAKEALEIDMQRNGVGSMESLEGMRYKDILKYEVVPDIESQFRGFEADLNEQSASRSNDVLRVLTTAFNTPGFVERNKNHPLWGQDGPAATYMRARAQYTQNREAIIRDARSKGVVQINRDDKGQDLRYTQMLVGLQNEWTALQEQLKRSSPAWAALFDRYIVDDSDPRDAGSMKVSTEEALP